MDIVLASSHVSAKHCAIKIMMNGEAVIMDHRSTNGTRIQSEDHSTTLLDAYEHHVVMPMDTFFLGDVALEYLPPLPSPAQQPECLECKLDSSRPTKKRKLYMA